MYDDNLDITVSGLTLRLTAPNQPTLTLRATNRVTLRLSNRLTLTPLPTTLPPINTAAGFLPTPDLADESDPIYFYWGWVSIDDTMWLIRRVERATTARADAAIDTNIGYPTLVEAWAAREILNYA